MGLTIVLLFAAAAVAFGLITGVRIVPQAKVMVVERLGKFHHVASSGLNILIPFMDSPRAMEMRSGTRIVRNTLVDLREQVMGFETVQVITHDNVNMEVGSVIYYQIVDPGRALYQVENLALAIEQLTMTNLRNVMGGLTLDQTLTSRETVNTKLRMVLDEATEKWGVKVTRVELREIEPPQAIKAAMAKQMTAERERRAEVTKAEGDKSAAILQAEGEKISRILRAEAERDAEVARAEGHKRAVMLEAEGKAEATRLTFEAIHTGRATPEVLALRYLETLQELGKGENKMFVPYEATAAMGTLSMLKDVFGREGTASPAPEAPRLPARNPSAAALSAQAIARNAAATATAPMPATRRVQPPPSDE
ncbi:SPFH/Band 7/PHB domain protein [Corallococcus praedator]|uniref:Protein QmcA n=1 Tax=Corallococcus praedator TaxID=2316724 RepID=A0ABX9QDX9_9BACT|nr:MULTISPECIES: SPFH domain-containing protein [Corallococcus]RKH06609.1 SPFH/Band 7/PHB domain protein [Corallococcus sp. CA047B]RKH31883.1 SPFH/Band 7/PHB domain protein [Corallococcus sp. CA031C]RKI02772.1 SPFH/Band 7/PHB domain protein [Corallococcus praedator]